MLKFELDISKCSSCGACAIACMDQNDIDIEAGERCFRSVFSVEQNEEGKPYNPKSYFSVACMHCDDAPCVRACPSGCISKDAETNFTIFDNTNCIGCHSCALACPFGAPAFDSNGKMQKCDGCIERVKHGMIPACVRVCPTGALQLLSDDDNVQIAESLLKLGSRMMDGYYG